MDSTAPSECDLQLAVKCSLPINSSQACVDALKRLLDEQRVTSLRDLLQRKQAIKDYSIRQINEYPHLSVRLLFMLAELTLELRRAHSTASNEAIEFCLRKFVDLCGGKKVNPREKLEEVWAAVPADIAGSDNIQLRRRNLGAIVDSGLGRSTWLQTALEDVENALVHGQEGASIPIRISLEASNGNAGHDEVSQL